MELEYKVIGLAPIGIDESTRTVTGVFAVHGNVDGGGDIGHPGLFGDLTVDGRKRHVFLWNHDASAPPIATIDRVYEIAAADLPTAVRAYAPNATGGTGVVRSYLDTPRALEVFAGLQAGAIREMSYAYRATRWDIEERDDRIIRNIYAAELYDISDVNWGMNPATSAAGKSAPLAGHHARVLADLRSYTDRLTDLSQLRAKEGRILSAENRQRITDAVDALATADRALRGLLAETDKAAPVLPPLAPDPRVLARRAVAEAHAVLAGLY